MEPSMETLISLVGHRLDSREVVDFFLTQPSTAHRRRQGRIDLAGIRSLSSKGLGYEVTHRKGRIETIFMYLSARDGYEPFRGRLIARLESADTRKEVISKLGPPTRSGTSDPAGSWVWDRYDSDLVCIHIAYGEAGVGVRMVTLMAPDVAPGGTGSK